ncbi:hypothetical protein [Streptomyces sp. 2132.2]|nr:hypothetical protein [Streptomyces sp. 2132.2]
MARRDYEDDPGAPAANRLVPAAPPFPVRKRLGGWWAGRGAFVR